jgi:hypothetical protein
LDGLISTAAGQWTSPFPEGAQNFPGSDASKTHVQLVPGALSKGVNRLGRETVHSHHLSVHLGITLILVLRFYSGVCGRIRTVYLFSLCVVSLLSSRFTATALVWFPDFLKCFVFHYLFH